MATLERKLVRTLDGSLTPAGFRRVERGWLFGDIYCREIGGVRHTLGFGTQSYLGALEATIGSASVRFNDVEEFLAKFEDRPAWVEPEDFAEAIAARSTLTVQVSGSASKRGDPLYSWGGTDDKIWLIRTADEIAATASAMAAYALETCEPIFTELSNRDVALSILSGDDEYARSHSGPDQARAKKAITLAFLTHEADFAKRLAESKLARLKGDDRAELKIWVERFFRQAG